MIEFKGNVNFQKVLWRNEKSVLFSFKTQGDKGFYCNAFCDSVFHDKLLSSDEIVIHGTLGNSKVKDTFREGKNGEKYDVWTLSMNVRSIDFISAKETVASKNIDPYKNVEIDSKFASDEIPF